MSDLAAFLLARIGEDEAANDEMVRAEVARCRADGMPHLTEDEVRAYWADQPWWKRRLAECEAKRRIVEHYSVPTLDDIDTPARYYPTSEHTLRALAAVYADHPDFDPSWRP